ncbi:MAG: hypothetical protein V4622_09950 [Bacteroidota bacterium]
MLSKKIKFNTGVIYKDDFIDIDKPLKNQVDNLYEDMFQLSFEDKLAMDIGYYGVEDNKFFKIYIIQNSHWDEPFYEKEIYDYSLLETEIRKAIEIFDKKALE